MKNERVNRLVKTYRSELSMLLVFIVFYIVMSIASPVFNTKVNVLNVLSQLSVVAILAIGQTFVIVSGGIDLSVGAALGLSGMLGAMYMSSTGDLAVGILIIVGSSILIGFFNGVLVGYLKIAAFIVTLGAQVICKSLTYVISDGNSYSGFPRMLDTVGNYKVFGTIRLYIVLMVLLYILMTWVMSCTKLGRFTYSIGSNAEASRLSGINVRLYTMLCYAVSGLMIGLAAVVNMIRLMAVDPTTGGGLEMDAIAASVIGGVSMAGGKGTLPGTLVGILLYSFLRNALNLLGINPFWQGTVTGVVIIVAVLAESLASKNNK